MGVESPIRETDNWFIGEDKVFEYPVADAAGVAVPITGWALEWALRYRPGDGAILTKTTGSGITITDGVGGVCQVAVADTDTDGLQAGRYWYALSRTDAGNEAVLAFGAAELRDV